MIRALIADDEPLARSVVRGLIAGYADVEVVGEGRNGVETLGAIRQLAPDLVFLDVQMPELDGFAVLASLAREGLPAVVFVTAHGQWVVSRQAVAVVARVAARSSAVRARAPRRDLRLEDGSRISVSEPRRDTVLVRFGGAAAKR